MIGAITSLLGERGVNIAQQAHARTHALCGHMQAHARGAPPPPLASLPPPQQINTSRGEIAYNVVDIPDAEGAEVTLAALHYLEGGATRLTCIHHAPTMRTPYIHYASTM